MVTRPSRVLWSQRPPGCPLWPTGTHAVRPTRLTLWSLLSRRLLCRLKLRRGTRGSSGAKGALHASRYLVYPDPPAAKREGPCPALFNLATDSKLRGCDRVSVRLSDVSHGTAIAKRAIALQWKTRRPVQFELTDLTRASIAEGARQTQLTPCSHLLPGGLSVPATCRPVSTCGSSRMGYRYWAGPPRIRNAKHATDQGIADLPMYQ